MIYSKAHCQISTLGGNNMTRTKKTFKVIGIILLALVILAGIITGIIFWCLGKSYVPGSMYINYSNLRRVMQDDVVYLSDEFLLENDLTILQLGESSDENVVLGFNNLNGKVKTDFTQRVEGIDEYTYWLKSNDNTDMPISVCVNGIAGKNDNIKTKCKQKTVAGYNYGMEYNGEVYYRENALSKGFVVRTIGKKSLINKKNCMLYIYVSVNLEDAKNYTDDEIIVRIDKVINSALNNIERYGN